jgi:hypothetical protein
MTDKNMTVRAPVEAEIVKAPAAQLSRAVTVGPAQLRRQMQRDQEIRAIIDEYIKHNMVAGKDYGSIEVKKGSGIMSKPSLFKPGAEKFCGLFKIRATFKKDIETCEMLGNTPGILAYICELVDSRGQVIGEGRGTAKASPDGVDFDINKQVKIAQKRAQVDAVLRAGGLSDFFTQDMEDAPRGNSHGNDTSPATQKQRELIAKKLSEIGVLTEDQKGYLIEQYGVSIPLTKEGASSVISELLGKAS